MAVFPSSGLLILTNRLTFRFETDCGEAWRALAWNASYREPQSATLNAKEFPCSMRL